MSSERRLLSEVTELARHLHWPLAELLDLEHPDRRYLLAELQRQTGDDAAGW